MDNRTSEPRNDGRWRALVLLSVVLVLPISTWFSASSVIPQIRELWRLNPTTSAWLTIAVQIGFVSGAIISSLINLADLMTPRHIIFGGAFGDAALPRQAGGLVTERGMRRIPRWKILSMKS